MAVCLHDITKSISELSTSFKLLAYQNNPLKVMNIRSEAERFIIEMNKRAVERYQPTPLGASQKLRADKEL